MKFEYKFSTLNPSIPKTPIIIPTLKLELLSMSGHNTRSTLEPESINI